MPQKIYCGNCGNVFYSSPDGLLSAQEIIDTHGPKCSNCGKKLEYNQTKIFPSDNDGNKIPVEIDVNESILAEDRKLLAALATRGDESLNSAQARYDRMPGSSRFETNYEKRKK